MFAFRAAESAYPGGALAPEPVSSARSVVQAREQVVEENCTVRPFQVPTTVATGPPRTITMHSTPGLTRSWPCEASCRQARARDGRVPPTGVHVSVQVWRAAAGSPAPCGE